MNILNKRVQKKIEDYVRSNYEQIEVLPGNCRFNYRCQMNAVHEALEADDNELAMTFYIDGDYPVIHFVNMHNGKYIDNTLGQWSKEYFYYLVKVVKKDEFKDINMVFDAFRKSIRDRLTWYERLLSNFES